MLNIYAHDPLVQVVKTSVIDQLVVSLRRRAQQAHLTEARFWDDILDALGKIGSETEPKLRVAIVRLNHLVNGEPINPPDHNRQPPLKTSKGGARIKRTYSGMSERGPMAWLSIKELSRLYTSCTVLTQNYGVLLNFRATLYAENMHMDAESLSRLARTYLHQVRQKLAYRTNRLTPFHFIHCLELGKGGFVARIAAHVPAFYIEEITEWSRTAFLRNQGISHSHRGLTVSTPLASKEELSFHWASFKVIARGLDPFIMARGDDGTLSPLIDLLKIDEQLREPTNFGASFALFSRSETLGPKVMRVAQEDNFHFLSALRDGAWSYIYSGWEAQEFLSRTKEKARRQQLAASIDNLFCDETDLARNRRSMEIVGIRSAFPADPRKRQRTWRGWWV